MPSVPGTPCIAGFVASHGYALARFRLIPGML
jgi:hypothetical protein